MRFEQLMKGLAEKLGGGLDLTPDDSGIVTLAVDDARVMIVNMDELSSVAFYAPVAQPPPDDHVEKLYEAALKANYETVRAAGATLSINHETGEIFLCRALPLGDLDANSFFKALEGFVSILDNWRSQVQDFRGDVQAAASADEPPPAFGAGSFMQV